MLSRNSLTPANLAIALLVLIGAASFAMLRFPDLAPLLVFVAATLAVVDCVAFVEREHEAIVTELRGIQTYVLPVVGAEHHEAVFLEGTNLCRQATAWRYTRHLRNLALVATVATGLLAMRADGDTRRVYELAQAVLFVALLVQVRAVIQARRILDEQRGRLANRLSQTQPARGWDAESCIALEPSTPALPERNSA